MSLAHTTTLSAHTAFTLSEVERESSISFSSSADRTTAVEDQYSIRLEAYPPSYKESTQNHTHKNIALLSDGQEETSMNIETMSKQKRRWLVFKRVAYIIIMNAAIPIALYYILKPHLPAVWALVLSSTPTIISVIVQAIFMKRIDSIGVGVIFGKQNQATFYVIVLLILLGLGFILSVVLAVLNGDPKMLLMRESFV